MRRAGTREQSLLCAPAQPTEIEATAQVTLCGGGGDELAAVSVAAYSSDNSRAVA